MYESNSAHYTPRPAPFLYCKMIRSTIPLSIRIIIFVRNSYVSIELILFSFQQRIENRCAFYRGTWLLAPFMCGSRKHALIYHRVLFHVYTLHRRHSSLNSSVCGLHSYKLNTIGLKLSRVHKPNTLLSWLRCRFIYSNISRNLRVKLTEMFAIEYAYFKAVSNLKRPSIKMSR